MRSSPASLFLFVAVAACAAHEKPPTADDAGVVWRSSATERDRARTLSTGQQLPGSGPHAPRADAALILGSDTALPPASTEGAIAISEIEGGDGGNVRPLLRGPTRAAGSSESVDYASIPLTEDRAATGADDGATFLLGPKSLEVPCKASNPPRHVVVWAPINWTSPGRVHLFDETLPFAFTAEAPDRGPPFMFHSADMQRFPATWLVLDDARRTAQSATLQLFAGTFDGKTTGVATTVAKVAMRALIPGVIYAYRHCVAGCTSDRADGPRRERVGLVGPQSIWRGSTAATQEQPRTNDALLPFTEVSALAGPGLSASLLIVATSDAVTLFRRPTSTERDSSLHTYSLEVVWPEGGEPDAALFSGTLDKPPQQVNPSVSQEESQCAQAMIDRGRVHAF